MTTAPDPAPLDALPEPPAMAVPESPAAERLGEEGEQQLVVVYGARRYRVRGWPKQLAEALKVNVLVSGAEVANADALHVDTLDLYQAKQRQAFAKLAAVELSVEESIIQHDLGRLLLKLEQLIEERAKAAELVFASLYGRVRSGQVRSVGIPDAGARALSAVIAAKAPIVGISFGNPYLLQNFPGLRTYIVAYGDMPSLQNAVARALMGEIDIVGKLPISLPGLYTRGTGIQTKATK